MPEVVRGVSGVVARSWAVGGDEAGEHVACRQEFIVTRLFVVTITDAGASLSLALSFLFLGCPARGRFDKMLELRLSVIPCTPPHTLCHYRTHQMFRKLKLLADLFF